MIKIPRFYFYQYIRFIIPKHVKHDAPSVSIFKQKSFFIYKRYHKVIFDGIKMVGLTNKKWVEDASGLRLSKWAVTNDIKSFIPKVMNSECFPFVQHDKNILEQWCYSKHFHLILESKLCLNKIKTWVS